MIVELGIYKHYRKEYYVEVIGVGAINKEIPRTKNLERLKKIATPCYLYCTKKEASLLLNTKTMTTYDIIPHDNLNSIPSYWFEEKIILYRIKGDKAKRIIARDYTSFFAMTSRGVSNFVRIEEEAA